MSFAPLMEHGLSGVHENFDPRDPGAMRYKSNGAITNKEDQLALSSGGEDNNGSRSGLPSWRATPGSSTLHLIAG